MSIKGEFTFLLLNFLIIGLCNSSANSLLEIFSFLTPLSEVFYFLFFICYVYFIFIKKQKYKINLKI